MASSTLPFSGKTVLITGGSKGIGGAISLLLAKQGASIAFNYSSDTAAADALVNKIGDTQRCLALKADASSLPGIEKIVALTVEKFGKIDILIPCAGILPMRGIEDTTEEDFDKAYNLNVKGPYFLAQKAIPHMPAGSHIVFLSTSLTTRTNVTANYTLYNSTKGAIEQITRMAAKGLAAKDIHVNAIAPGPTATDMFLKGKSEEIVKAIASDIPFKRLGEPDEIASALVFLCSETSNWVHGQTLRVNGGMSV